MLYLMLYGINMVRYSAEIWVPTLIKAKVHDVIRDALNI